MSTEYYAIIAVGLPSEEIESLPNFSDLECELDYMTGGEYPVWGLSLVSTSNRKEINFDNLPQYAETQQFIKLTGLKPKLYILIDRI